MEVHEKPIRVDCGTQELDLGAVNLNYYGFGQPYYVRHNEFGRGIYAATNIPKGSLVWRNIRSAQFSDCASFREFILRLPADLACDALEWSYVDMHHKINVDLDEGALCNDGGSTDKNIDIDKKLSNLFLVRPGMQLFAMRYIGKDEELLCDYESFSSMGWRQFGLR